MKNKIFIMALVSLLFINQPIRCYASAGTLVVQGGTIATGGLAVGALAGLAGPAVVIVFASMMAMGIDIELTQQSQQAGMTKTEFVKNKLNDYCHEAGITAGVFYKGILDGAQVIGDGKIKLSDYACKRIRQFINWLDSNGEIGSSAGTQADSVTIGNHNLMYVSNGSYFSNTFTYSGDTKQYTAVAETGPSNSTKKAFAYAYLHWASGNYTPVMLSQENFYGKIGLVGGRESAWATHRGSYYYRIGTYSSVTNYVNSGLIPTPTIEVPSNITSTSAWIDSLDGSFVLGNNDNVDRFTGDNVDTGALSPSGSGSAVINPGLTGSIPIPADTNVTVNVQDYLDALDKLLNGIQDVTVGAIDQATGVPIDMDIPDTLVIDPTISREEDDPIHPQIETPIVNDDDPADPEETPNLVTDPLKFDLKTIFPFCIPFDIKDMLSLLNADPVAPRYDVDWHIPIANVDLEFTIDLSVWNDVALIARKMELLAFIVGLAVVTRNIIRG